MNEGKPILAIETSASVCAAAIYYSAEKYFTSSTKLKHSHSEKLFEIIELLFQQAGIKRNEIGSVAVSAGPGSFTGLRIGMAAAKAIARATEVPLIAVPTFEALAYQIYSYNSDMTEFIIANKVNKDEVYYSKFKISSNTYIFTDEVTILTNHEFVEKSIGFKIFGNATYLINKDQNSNVICSPSAEYIADWVLKFGKKNLTFEYDYLEPIYLKDFIVKMRYNK